MAGRCGRNIVNAGLWPRAPAVSQELSRDEAIIESLRSNVWPVFLTSVTTAGGFLTLNASEGPILIELLGRRNPCWLPPGSALYLQRPSGIGNVIRLESGGLLELPHEAQLEVGVLVVVELRVGVPHLVGHRDLRTEAE